jgi:phosphate transport system permease protein
MGGIELMSSPTLQPDRLQADKAPVPLVRPCRKSPGGRFWTQGEPLVWATGGALAAVLAMALTLLVVVMAKGLGVFWPSAIVQVKLVDGKAFLGKRIRSETNPDDEVCSVQFKTANRELDPKREDFHWVPQEKIAETTFPKDAVVLERLENGDFFGYLKEVQTPGMDLPPGEDLNTRLASAFAAVRQKQARESQPLAKEIYKLRERHDEIEKAAAKTQYARKQAIEAGEKDSDRVARLDARIAELRADSDEVNSQTGQAVSRQQKLEADLRRNVAVFTDGQGQEHAVMLTSIVRYYQPNKMGLASKVGHYLSKVWELLTTNPRESNTEGGLFPAIFGTVMLVFLMTLSCFPLGVLAGIYLGEYARDGALVRLVRIGVNNLAGIPSIVYGIFGVGFFVYGLGGYFDKWFFPERSGPTFGTEGILWASLTLGLLTVPVVIVATEEALRAIPRGIRESSFALGATKFQTLYRVLVPLASPGIMTGLILAMARAAGEVAPLMITGVVKSAPTLPVDGQFPFFHLDRKFMHLGFHIFDIGFQPPNAEAAAPMVYVTTFLLVLIVLMMCSLAIYLRNRMRKKLQMRTV